MTEPNDHLELTETEQDSPEVKQKKMFARLYLQFPTEPFKAAEPLFSENEVADMAYAASFWPNDPVVLAEMAMLRNSVDMIETLPGKYDLLKLTWEKLQNARTADDFAKLGKLYAEVRNLMPSKDDALLSAMPQLPPHPVYKVVEE